MKKYPKIVQCDKRGQIVIPKDIRDELGIAEGTGFYMYSVTDEGILLKKIPEETLGDQDKILDEIKDKGKQIGVRSKNVEKSVKDYNKKGRGKLEEI